MVYVSEMSTTPPKEFGSELEEKTYEILTKLEMPFYQVATGEALTMEDCIDIDKRLGVEVVKTFSYAIKRRQNFICTSRQPISNLSPKSLVKNWRFPVFPLLQPTC